MNRNGRGRQCRSVIIYLACRFKSPSIASVMQYKPVQGITPSYKLSPMPLIALSSIIKSMTISVKPESNITQKVSSPCKPKYSATSSRNIRIQPLSGTT